MKDSVARLLKLYSSNVQFKKEFGGAPLLHGPLDNIFKNWEQMLTKMVSKYDFPPPDTSVDTKDVQIDTDDSRTITCRIYTPPSTTSAKKLAVYFHGGGWAMGDLDTEDAQCRIISKQCGVVLVSVDYRLAPQHKYPAPLDDCAEGAKWAIKNATTLVGNTDSNAGQVVVIGTSAGGGLAFSTALRLIDERLADKIAGVVAMVPVTVHPDAVPADMKSRYTSYDEHAENTVNTKSAMEAFFGKRSLPYMDCGVTLPLSVYVADSIERALV
jgi:versiconal hemiacetal acetate esterase